MVCVAETGFFLWTLVFFLYCQMQNQKLWKSYKIILTWNQHQKNTWNHICNNGATLAATQLFSLTWKYKKTFRRNICCVFGGVSTQVSHELHEAHMQKSELNKHVLWCPSSLCVSAAHSLPAVTDAAVAGENEFRIVRELSRELIVAWPPFMKRVKAKRLVFPLQKLASGDGASASVCNCSSLSSSCRVHTWTGRGEGTVKGGGGRYGPPSPP